MRGLALFILLIGTAAYVWYDPSVIQPLVRFVGHATRF